MNTIKDIKDQIVLITGASQGLGKQFAHKYYKETKQTRIIIISRSNEKLKNVIREIINDETFDPISLDDNNFSLNYLNLNRICHIAGDLSNYDIIYNILDKMNKLNLRPDIVLHCVGGSIPKLYHDLTIKELQLGIDQNYKSVINITHSLSKIWPNIHKKEQESIIDKNDKNGSKDGNGSEIRIRNESMHIIFFSSECAFFPFIGYSQYAPMKVALKSLIMILRQEWKNCRISMVYPGNFQSEGFENEQKTKPQITKDIEGPSEAISVEECCNRIIYWLNKGYDDILTDKVGWLLMALDMGLNKNQNNVFLWWLQLIVGSLGNLFVVPIAMFIINLQITKYFRDKFNKN